MIERFTQLFPVWALVFSALAYAMPGIFSPLAPTIVPLLGVVMFGMGVTLTPDDFTRIARRPGLIGLGTVLQFGVMPLVAWLLATMFGVSPYMAAGLILVGSCPGGTASNVVCFLARGDVALSISLTTVSTLLSVVATPALTWAYAGRLVPVPVLDMLQSILIIVIVPVLAGVTINTLWGRHLARSKRLFPALSVLAIVVIVAIIVALNRDRLPELGPVVAAAVVLHNLFGLLGGYWIPRGLGVEPRACRALAIEVGMQNSGLAVALAKQYFAVQATLPGAVFSIWHNLSGSVLAGYWARQGVNASEPDVNGSRSAS